jgi:NAD(P)H-flavin reductase
MSVPRIVVELKARVPLSRRVHRLRFAARSPFAWAAGQYLVVVVAQGQEVFLPYSIASAHDPRKPAEFELAAAFQAGADVIDSLPLGATLEIEGPFGDFTWQPSPGPAALLVGVGTGIAPLRALIEEELARRSQRRLILVAGHRAPEDVLFAADFARLETEHARFRFVPTLSRAGEVWTGHHGRVQSRLIEAARSLGELDAYVCGRVDMVSDVVSALQAQGVRPERIRSEGF